MVKCKRGDFNTVIKEKLVLEGSEGRKNSDLWIVAALIKILWWKLSTAVGDIVWILNKMQSTV